MTIPAESKSISTVAAASVAISRGAPARLINQLVEGAKLTTTQYECAEKAWQAFDKGASALIHGRIGCGKSMVGARFMLDYAKDRHVARMYTVAGLMAAQKNWFNNKMSDRGQAPIELATECKLLVVDELMAASGSMYDHSQLVEIIKARYDHLRPTLILTNVVEARLEETLSKHVVDRLVDGNAIMHMGGTSMRSGNAPANSNG